MASKEACSKQQGVEVEQITALIDGPDDTLFSVLSWLNVAEIGLAMAVCRRWARFAGSDFLWLPLYNRSFCFGRPGCGGLTASRSSHSQPQQHEHLCSQRQRPFQGQTSPASARTAPIAGNVPGAQTTTAHSRNPVSARSNGSASSNETRDSGDDPGLGLPATRPGEAEVVERAVGGAEKRSEVTAGAGMDGERGMPRLDTAEESVRYAFRARLTCPMLGDHVQVAWRGKFRLDSQLVFLGVSWWAAKVVAVDIDPDVAVLDESSSRDSAESAAGSNVYGLDPGEGGGVGEQPRPSGHNVLWRATRYRVHYRSWSRRWDEWVEPSMLRWKSSAWASSRQDKARCFADSAGGACTPEDEEEFHVDQPVELYCHGDAAGGAWLDARVRKVSSDSVCLSDMSSSSQLLWVHRDRIRPKPAAPATLAAIALKAYGGVESAGVQEATGTLTRNECRSAVARVIAFARRSRSQRRMTVRTTVPATGSGGRVTRRLTHGGGDGESSETCSIM